MIDRIFSLIFILLTLSLPIYGNPGRNSAHGRASHVFSPGRRSHFPNFVHSIIKPSVDWSFEYKPTSLKKLHGFKYCERLEGSLFDMSVPVDPSVLGKFMISHPLDVLYSSDDSAEPVDSDSSDKEYEYQPIYQPKKTSFFGWNFETPRAMDFSDKLLVNFIDGMAYLLERDVIKNYNLFPLLGSSIKKSAVSAKSAKDFACFLAADGHNDWVQLVTFNTKRKFLQFVDGMIYFEGFPSFYPLDMRLSMNDALGLSKKVYGHFPSEKEGKSGSDACVRAKEDEKFLTYPILNTNNGQNTENYDEKPQFRPIMEKYHRRTMPHKIAYVMIVHKDYESVVKLLESLMDPYVVIIIHVDEKNPELKYGLTEYVFRRRRDDSNFDRVRVMQRTAKGAWGHISLVSAQLAAFFELLDFDSSWEYVINISGNDYPLRHNDVIYSDLKKNHPGQNLIEYWPDLQSYPRLNFLPLLLNEEGFAGVAFGRKKQQANQNGPTINNVFSDEINLETSTSDEEYPGIGYIYDNFDDKTNSGTFLNRYSVKPPRMGRLVYPYPSFKLVKHHQWMILNREFVRWMRSSPITMYLLAYNEFTSIPDESFFGILALNTKFRDTLANQCKRHLYFSSGARHPDTITIDDLPELKKAVEENGKIFTRKVELGCSDDLLGCLNEYRDQDRARWLMREQRESNLRSYNARNQVGLKQLLHTPKSRPKFDIEQDDSSIIWSKLGNNKKIPINSHHLMDYSD